VSLQPSASLPYDWVVSDLHLLLEAKQYRPRGADELIVANWPVTATERVLFLGDLDGMWGLGFLARQDAEDAAIALGALLEKLPGRVTLVAGNWDSDDVLEVADAAGWAVARADGDPVKGLQFQYRGWVVDCGHFPAVLVPGMLSLHGHFHPPAPCLQGHLHEPGEEVASHFESSRRHINVAAPLRSFKPLRLQELLDERIDHLEGSC